MAEESRVEEEGSSAAAASLTDDHVVDIFSRLPARSLCRFRCVSRHWSGLVSHPDHRARLPQTLSGLFFRHLDADGGGYAAPAAWGFAGFYSPERGPPLLDPPLSFLPTRGDVHLLDSCNGLLLLRCWGAAPSRSPPAFVVCNPATRRWISLPAPTQAAHLGPAFLGFDPAVSSHFYLFLLVEDADLFADDVREVEIYSSETEKWELKRSGWSRDVSCLGQTTTYLNGFMHFVTHQGAVAAVDTTGQTWRIIPAPRGGMQFSFIGNSQGCLFYVDTDRYDDAISSAMYVLEDHGAEEWVPKHSVSSSYLLGLGFGGSYNIIAVHPHCNLVFFFHQPLNTLLSYNMDSRNVRIVCILGQVGHPFLPYIPLYSDAWALSNICH